MNDTFILSTRSRLVGKKASQQESQWRRFERNEMLYTARCRQQWSMTVASSRVGVSLGAYSDWERGRTLPLRHWLYALCTQFQLPPAALGFPIALLPYMRPEDHEHTFIGQRCEPLFEHRLATGKIACDIAEEIGVETHEYLAWELGKAIPSPMQLDALCCSFRCTPEQLGFLLTADMVRPDRSFSEQATDDASINALLYQARKQRGWSKVRTAQHIGVSVTAYRHWEAGRCIPSLPHLHRLCQAFQLPQEQLGYPPCRGGGW